MTYAKSKLKHNYPLIWNLSNTNEYFVGRKLILDHIKDDFKKKKNIITLYGSSGVGKTQVAKKYAEVNKQRYDIVWWIDSSKNIEDQFKKFALAWNNVVIQSQKIDTSLPTQEITKLIIEKLRITNLNWLLIIDNASDTDIVKDYLPTRHENTGYGHILITSKNPFSWSNIMKLDKFDRNESIELITKIAGEHNKQELSELAEILGDYPLALVQASAYIRLHPSISINEYKKLFLTNRDKLWKEENNFVTKHAVFDNYKLSVFTTFALIIDKIEKISPQSTKLLAFISFLHNKNIPKTLLIQYLSDMDVVDKLKQEQIISILLEYSLLTMQEKAEDYYCKHLSEDFSTNLKFTFTIHEITQLVIQNYLESKNRIFYLENSIKSMVKFLPNKLDILFPLIESNNPLILHMQTLMANSTKYSVCNENSVMLKIRELEYFLSAKRNYPYSKELLNNIEKEIFKISNNKVALVRYYLMKAVYRAWHDYDHLGKITETNKALELLNELNGDYTEEYLMAYNRLIQSYTIIGDNEKALEYAKLGENTISSAKNFLSTKDVFYHSLAKIYMDYGQLDKAYNYAIMAINSITPNPERLLMGDLPLHLLACEIMIKNNKVEEAYRKTLYFLKYTKEKTKGQDDIHLALFMILHGYSSFLKNLNQENNYQAEIDLLINGQEMLRKVFGDIYRKSRIVALSYIFLGDIYEQKGDYVKANINYTAAETVLSNTYDLQKFSSDDVSNIYSKLAKINVFLNDPVTAQIYLSKLQKKFGSSHSRAKEVTNYFLDHGFNVGF